MPTDCAENALADPREWFISALDQRFVEQEAVIRRLLDDHLQLLRCEPSGAGEVEPELEETVAMDAAPGEEVPKQDVAAEAPLETTIKVEDGGKNTGTGLHGQRSTSSHRATKLEKHVLTDMSEDMEDASRYREWVKGPLDVCVAVVVILNFVCMAARTQEVGNEADVRLGLSERAPNSFLTAELFLALDVVFCSIYVLDVLVRMLVLRREWLYDEVDGFMFTNVFDLILVLIHVLEIVLASSGSAYQQVSALRIWKLLRLVLTVRIMKTVNLFRQLRVLISACISSLSALFWSLVLMVLLELGFTIIICQSLQEYILDERQDLETRRGISVLYGSFGRALYTVFELTFSGGWIVRVRPVVDNVSHWYAIPFLCYITIVVFAVTRIVTAIFLKETLANAANDAALQLAETKRMARGLQSKFEELFRSLDGDGSESISFSEFSKAMSYPSVQQYLSTLDLKVQDCAQLFEILDDGDGKITIAEFSHGLMLLKGQARALDIMVLQRENAKVLKECQGIREALCAGVPSTLRKQTKPPRPRAVCAL
ncbi:Scn10a [Symbiodinium natans]|uniref:Scn10a protein n=1 Tax=Symbiodinium natans TaxID=878477 RepID=A0A812LNG3_9DINO|nr:Scn10a [Symbiodinium natans]